MSILLFYVYCTHFRANKRDLYEDSLSLVLICVGHFLQLAEFSPSFVKDNSSRHEWIVERLINWSASSPFLMVKCDLNSSETRLKKGENNFLQSQVSDFACAVYQEIKGLRASDLIFPIFSR